MKRKTLKISRIATVGLALPWLLTSAYADAFQTFTADWSGTSYANVASAVATFTLDVTAMDAALNNNTGGTYFGVLNGYISGLSMTVTGASSGNGTFTTSDFSDFYIQTSGPINFSSELGAQPNFGDFNFFSTDGAPDGTATKTLTTANDSGDSMLLGSVTPAPEPSTLALSGLGTLSGLFLLRRQKLSKA